MYSYPALTRFVCMFAALLTLAGAAVRAEDAPAAPSEMETQLLAVLQSDAPKAEKAIVCKRLAIHGSSAAVGQLAKLLPDEQLASWARIALEAIPGPEADEALRDASRSLDGKLLVGVINSLGVRADAGSVDLLAERLRDEDAAVASAAAVALGHIGNDDAAQVLRQALPTAAPEVRLAVAEGCILCAERFHRSGNATEAVAIYDQVRGADVPAQRIIEATRGAILARGPEGIPLLMEQFQSPDKNVFQLALSTAREFPGNQVDEALAAEMLRVPPERAALIVQAMADRPETVRLPALVTAASEGPKLVRLAAIDALGRVGNVSCLPSLLRIAVDEDDDLAQGARTTLAMLPDEQVDQEIAGSLPAAEGAMVPVLIELVGRRRIKATPALRKALEHPEQAVRIAALTALGETISQEDLPVLIFQAIAPRFPDDAAAARQALKAASIRMPDREACADQLVEAMERSEDVATKSVLLEILGSMGGARALAALAEAGKDTDPRLQDTGTRLLGEWMTADAAPVLLQLAENAPEEKYRIRALRGYIRIARQFVLPVPERAEMCRRALTVSRRPDEQKLVLDVLKRYPHAATLRVAVDAMGIDGLKEPALEAALVIANELGAKNEVARQFLAQAQLEKVQLEIVKAEYGSGSTQKDVTPILRKHAEDSRLISLPSSNYNTLFGGDPVPGTPKQLTIQYRLNGKLGEASFAEGDLLILPVPR